MPINYYDKIHHPPHIYLDDTIYFISAHAHGDRLIFTNKRKKDLLSLILKLLDRYNYKLFAYALLDNHYHLLVKVLMSKYLPDIFQNLHGSLSFKWNKEDTSQGRTVFQNYWDYCIRGEKDFWTHFNYIQQNPIKHGLVKNLEELKNYEFCSYGQWLKNKGEEWMSEVWENYPVVDFTVPDEGIMKS